MNGGHKHLISAMNRIAILRNGLYSPFVDNVIDFVSQKYDYS